MLGLSTECLRMNLPSGATDCSADTARKSDDILGAVSRRAVGPCSEQATIMAVVPTRPAQTGTVRMRQLGRRDLPRAESGDSARCALQRCIATLRVRV